MSKVGEVVAGFPQWWIKRRSVPLDGTGVSGQSWHLTCLQSWHSSTMGLGWLGQSFSKKGTQLALRERGKNKQSLSTAVRLQSREFQRKSGSKNILFPEPPWNDTYREKVNLFRTALLCVGALLQLSSGSKVGFRPSGARLGPAEGHWYNLGLGESAGHCSPQGASGHTPQKCNSCRIGKPGGGAPGEQHSSCLHTRRNSSLHRWRNHRCHWRLLISGGDGLTFKEQTSHLWLCCRRAG